MIQALREMFSPEQRKVIGQEARQSLEDRHWKDAFEAVEGYLVEAAKTCDPDNKEKSSRIVISMQLLDAIKRELHRKVADGEFAAVEIEQIERARKPLRFIR